VHHVGAPLFSIADHGTELGAAEDATFFTNSLRRVEDRAPRIEFDRDGDDQEHRSKNHQDQDRNDDVESALEEQADFRNLTAMKRDGGELADVLNGAVPGQAVVHIGDHTKGDAMGARLIKHILHDPPFAAGCKENFIDELLAGVLEEGVQGSDNIS
jgi:hypothetical protein